MFRVEIVDIQLIIFFHHNFSSKKKTALGIATKILPTRLTFVGRLSGKPDFGKEVEG